ncbi:MAG: LysR substrate-binding domain-containing protein [Ramlibacter sp.]|nr:LysR substrate-binding domain-containing protein [Ramlibacter sp.]
MARKWVLHGMQSGRAVHGYHCRMRDLQFDDTAEGQWRTNDTNMAATMVLQGLGIGRLATLVGDALVARRHLVPVLEKFVDPRPVAVYAVTAGGRHRLPKIKACIDYWAEWFGTAR